METSYIFMMLLELNFTFSFTNKVSFSIILKNILAVVKRKQHANSFQPIITLLTINKEILANLPEVARKTKLHHITSAIIKK